MKIKTGIVGVRKQYGIHVLIGNCGFITERIWDTKAEAKLYESMLKRSLKREINK